MMSPIDMTERTTNEAIAPIFVAVGALAVSGCTVVMAPPHPPHPAQGPPAEVGAGVVDGDPQPGAQPNGLGIWIWRTADGKWHVRSASAKKVRTFRGLVEGKTSPIGWYEIDRMEVGDNIGYRGQSLVFLFETGGHLDGFDFVPDDHGCVRFHITLDEHPFPSRIYLGKNEVNPPSEHFVACP